MLHQRMRDVWYVQDARDAHVNECGDSRLADAGGFESLAATREMFCEYPRPPVRVLNKYDEPKTFISITKLM